MWFSRKQVAKEPLTGAGPGTAERVGQITTKRIGDAAESLALAHLARPVLSQNREPYCGFSGHAVRGGLKIAVGGLLANTLLLVVLHWLM